MNLYKHMPTRSWSITTWIFFKWKKKYTVEINSYADKVMLFDSKSAESLIAKGLSFAHKKDYKQAVPYLEKALDYNPNSGLVIHFLTEFWVTPIDGLQSGFAENFGNKRFFQNLCRWITFR